MDLLQYVTALRKGWWIIVLAVLLGAGCGALVNVRATPQYASTVTFFISTATEGGTSPLAADQFATRRITSYVGLLSSDVVAQRVLDTTGVDLTESEVKARITGDADLNTVLLTATATDSSPERSFAIADGIAKQFGAIVNDVDPIGPDNVVLRTISGPTLNPVPISPRTTLNLAAGVLLGLVVGVVVALMRQVLDTTVRQPQLLRGLTDAPVLGIIPFEKSARKSPLVVDGGGRSIRAEALRQLRTNLQFVDVERPVRVLVVTSSVADEGKSTTATNLAVAFAESGRRVLLVEADLRRPRVADYLNLERSVGLTNVLAGQVEIADVLQQWGEGGLTVLPSGSIPPNPSELLGSPRMLELLEYLKTLFDVLVIDTPPLLPVTDGAVAAAHADGAVLVVRYGKTSRGQIINAVRSLKSVDARLLGTILNMTPRKGADGYESYGYGYYDNDPSNNTVIPAEPIDTSSANVAREGQSGSVPWRTVPAPSGDDPAPAGFRLTSSGNGSTDRPAPRRALRMKPGAPAE